MAWSGSNKCGVSSCREEGNRHVEWAKKVAGDFYLCESHFKDYRRRFPRQIVVKEKVKPDDRFSENPTVRTPTQEATQLEF